MKIKLSQTGRRLSVLIGILTAMIASGCESEDTMQYGPHTKAVANQTVTITFVNGCPTKVTPTSQSSCEPTAEAKLTAEATLPADLVCAKRGDAVEWVSEPADTPFVVYFDPFVGQRYASHGKDQKTAPVIVRRDTVPGVYKYSVQGVVCTDGEPVLDPPIRVED